MICLLVPEGPAHAIDADVGTRVAQCQFAETVRVGGTCTGVYVGNDTVLTAGHCRSGNTTPTSVAFGDGVGGVHYKSYYMTSCIWHPGGDHGDGVNGNGTYEGVDLMVCKLADIGPNVPVIPPMVPNGCERDWLASRLANYGFVAATAVGLGCEDNYGPNCTSGKKRFVAPGNPANFRLITQMPGGRLLFRAFNISGVLQSGDSGGPAYVRLPDSTYRLIGVAHSKGVEDEYQAVPSYLHWIEATAGEDLTPCHNRNASGQWIFHGGCRGSVVKRPELPGRAWGSPTAMMPLPCQPSGSQWSTFYGGGASACAGWNPDVILGMNSGLVAPSATMTEIEAGLDASKHAPWAPQSCDERREFIDDAVLDESRHLFLAERPMKHEAFLDASVPSCGAKP